MAAYSFKKLEAQHAPALKLVFTAAINGQAASHYNLAQRKAWLAAADALTAKLNQHYFLGAFNGVHLVGFASLSAHGCLDHVFVHPQYTRQGLAKNLHQRLEALARKKHSRLYTYASHSAKAFFMAMGYSVIRSNNASLNDQILENFLMEKVLATH